MLALGIILFVFYDLEMTRINRTILDGLSYYDESFMDEYNNIHSCRPPKDLYEKVKTKEKRNPYEVDLTVAEIGFLKTLDLLAIKYKILNPSWNISNDLFMLGREWELKTISKKTDGIIKYTFWKITDQGKRNAILDVTYLNRKLEWVFSKIRTYLEIIRKGEFDDIEGKPITNNDLIDSVIVVRNKKLIRYK